MQAWAGTAIGSFIGLVALLLGALYNAHLMRKRDNTMQNNERDAIAAAVAAECAGMADALLDRFGFMAHYVSDGATSHTVGAVVARCALPESIVIQSLGAEIGKLEPELAYQVVRAWHNVGLLRNLMATTVAELRAHAVNKANVISRNGYAQDLSVKLHDLAQRLGGLNTGVNASKTQVSIEEMQAMMARQPGQDQQDRMERDA